MANKPAPPKLSIPKGLPQFIAKGLTSEEQADAVPIPVDAQVEDTYDAYWSAIGHTVPYNVNRVRDVIARLPRLVS